ncbi:MAG TPA: gfo/Idh/MocA family oxidoreductase, partial [Lacipirellulaceae bacterium]|nr:gfo/Idh/MocA family oxidoreductase [Lacipirellulaceae bacterium]
MATRSVDRRQFMSVSAALGGGAWIGGAARAAEERPRGDRIRFACIGVGGKGEGDAADAARFGDVVAICDVDELRLAAA